MTDFKYIIKNWYKQNKRDLPWRNTKNPYFIWLSEVILQQTRVVQGINYYQKFILNFPTIESLASAEEQEILNNWQGLGYYSRARNLHKAAKQVMEEFEGNFPKNYDSIIKLKGVGEYTAAAISSFAFNEAKPVIDGNVFRVLSRTFNIDTPIDSTDGKKIFKELALELFDFNDPSTYNQAIMEFGALQCTPVNPNCNTCPLIHKCLAFSNNTITSLPKKKQKVKIKNRYFHYILSNNKSEIIIQKRTKKDIWQNMWQLPMLEFDTKFEVEESQKMITNTINSQLDLVFIKELPKHILSHQHIHATFWHVKNQNISIEEIFEDSIIINKNQLEEFPVPRLIEKFFEDYLQFI